MRKVCVITGTRAEYGLLRNLMTDLRDAPDLMLKVIATGAHLVGGHGETVREIEADGFAIDETVDMLLASDTPQSVGISMGLGVMGLTTALSRLKPDIIVLLGDRYEVLAAAQSAMILGIPIAHIHGGEATEGLIDEAIRHSITKMSHIHFVAADPYRSRVIQLGEQPDMVHTVGATGLDNIANLDWLSKESLEKSLQMTFGHRLFLVTYHPVTLDHDGHTAVLDLFDALDGFPDASVVFTGSNADPQGALIDEKIRAYCAARSDRVKHFSSLGVRRYLSLMKQADAVIGNSSSGLLEAPTVGVPTVNIGPRQRGRLRGPSVIDTGSSSAEISMGIDQALSEASRTTAARRESPYGTPGAARKIAKALSLVQLDGILMKKFHDI